MPWLAGEGNNFFTNLLLWPGFENTWPTTGPAGSDVRAWSAWGIPALNTAILLSSGVTITIAHHMLRAGHRRGLTVWLAATLCSASCSWACRRTSTCTRIRSGFRLDTGIYGSTFFMLTGFHGLHVTLGAIMLIVIWLRILRGHFTPRPPLRVRSGGLVLALRRCRLARIVRLRLLGLMHGRCSREPPRPCGSMSPVYHASIRNKKNATDRPTRTVSALSRLRELSPRLNSAVSATPKLASIPAKNSTAMRFIMGVPS